MTETGSVPIDHRAAIVVRGWKFELTELRVGMLVRTQRVSGAIAFSVFSKQEWLRVERR